MEGAISSRDVVRHAFTIVRLWGPGLYARCLLAVACGRRTTFLDVLGEAEAFSPSQGDGASEGKQA